MSIRPREAFEASQSFSLRDALTTSEPAAHRLPAPTGGNLKFNLGGLQKPSSPEPVQTVPRPVALPAGLSLRFSQTPVQQESLSLAAPQKIPNAIPNLSFANMAANAGKQRSLLSGQHAAAQAKEHATNKADVMRLTAYVDELTSRLKKTQSRLDQTESQLTRTSHVLCQERQVSDRVLAGYKNDLALAHDTEGRLREEIAGTKKRSSLKDATFMASVDSALASDDEVRAQQRTLAELETKVGAMGEFKVKLETEVEKLDTLRKTAQRDLDTLKLQSEESELKAKAALDSLESAQGRLLDVRGDHDTVVERLACAKVAEATLTEAVSALHTTKEFMEKETATTHVQTQALLVKHGEAAKALTELKTRVSLLTEQEATAAEALRLTTERCATAEARLAAAPPPPLVPALTPINSMHEFQLDGGDTSSCALEGAEKKGEGEGDSDSDSDSDSNSDADKDETTAAPPPLAATPVTAPRRMAVTGVAAPARPLCTGLPAGGAAHLAHKAMGPRGIAALAATDAPAGLTLQRVDFIGARHCMIDAAQKSGKDPSTAMINAVVGDLKEKLTEISQQQPVWRAVAPLA